HPTGRVVYGSYYEGKANGTWKSFSLPPRLVHIGQPQPPHWWNELGFWAQPYSQPWETPDVSRNDYLINIGVPLWFVMIISALMPARRGAAWWRMRHRRHMGLCEQCGYDLRASKGKCPECGSVPRQTGTGKETSRISR